MKIESVDFFYLSLPEVRDIGDGSQDAVLVRVQAGGFTGWGQCEASPLVCIASWNCPMSHSACKPLSSSVLGQTLDCVKDIQRIHALTRANSFDLLQTGHTLSGIDVALWDLLARKEGVPVYQLLGYKKAHPKIAYASQLFGDDAQTTYLRAREVASSGFRAAKFGWGPYGRSTPQQDSEQVHAARNGLGPDRLLLVDAGTIWVDDVEQAVKRLAALQECGALWLEEPFETGALGAYRELAGKSGQLKLAGGEGCHNFHQAKNMIDYAGVGYIQIDAGRIGGISTAKAVVDYADSKGIQFVNHTFTTSLAVSASVQPYAGLETHALCEFPAAPSKLAQDFTKTSLAPNGEGYICLPEQPGLGVEPDLERLEKYALRVKIQVGDKTLFQSKPLTAL